LRSRITHALILTAIGAEDTLISNCTNKRSSSSAEFLFPSFVFVLRNALTLGGARSIPMRVLQSTGTDPSGVLGMALSSIRRSAQQVICYSEDLENAPHRSDAKRLPAALPVSASLKSLVPHSHKDIVCIRTIVLQSH
jgi:hypothetical protein